MRRLLVNMWLRIAKIKDRILNRHNIEIVDYKDPVKDLEIEEALALSLENEEKIKKAFQEKEIPFSEINFNENETLKELKELSDKLTGMKFKVLKRNMSKEEFKYFKRVYNRNLLYKKLKKLSRKL